MLTEPGLVLTNSGDLLGFRDASTGRIGRTAALPFQDRPTEVSDRRPDTPITS